MIRLFWGACLTSVFILASVAIGPAAEQDNWTGYSILEGCRAAATKLSPDVDIFAAGVCAGEIRALVEIAGELKDEQLRSCTPNQIGTRQIAKVVVSYLEHHRTILHQQLSDLVIAALADAWPCQTAK